jgi:hypothetical protein
MERSTTCGIRNQPDCRSMKGTSGDMRGRRIMIEFTNELWSVFISVIALAGTLGSLLMARTAGDDLIITNGTVRRRSRPHQSVDYQVAQWRYAWQRLMGRSNSSHAPRQLAPKRGRLMFGIHTHLCPAR